VSSWPEPADLDLPDAQPWDRRPGEPSRNYGAFRLFRDLPPHQRTTEAVAERVGVTPRAIRRWAEQWDWRGRTDHWDDATHHIEDQERLDAIRSMHAVHRRAGRAAMLKAMQALTQLNPEDMPPSVIARMMELGAKLERSTLIVSVEELQGLDIEDEDEAEDPWDVIARELDPTAFSNW